MDLIEPTTGDERTKTKAITKARCLHSSRISSFFSIFFPDASNLNLLDLI